MQYLSPKLLEAFEFAAAAHKDQLRKSPGGIPYISHPAAVALVLAQAGYGEDVVIAGLLHDVVEDTKFTNDDIRRRFGGRVADLVAGVTENKRLEWDERHQGYNDHLKSMDSETAAVSAADLLANRQSILLVFKQGRNAWETFSKNPKTYAEKCLAFDAERIAIIKGKVNKDFILELEALEQQVIEYTKKIGW